MDLAETSLASGTGAGTHPCLWGNLFLPHDRQDGVRARIEHEPPDLMDRWEVRTLSNLVRARTEVRRMTAGWAAVRYLWDDGAGGSQSQPGVGRVHWAGTLGGSLRDHCSRSPWTPKGNGAGISVGRWQLQHCRCVPKNSTAAQNGDISRNWIAHLADLVLFEIGVHVLCVLHCARNNYIHTLLCR